MSMRINVVAVGNPPHCDCERLFASSLNPVGDWQGRSAEALCNCTFPHVVNLLIWVIDKSDLESVLPCWCDSGFRRSPGLKLMMLTKLTTLRSASVARPSAASVAAWLLIIFVVNCPLQLRFLRRICLILHMLAMRHCEDEGRGDVYYIRAGRATRLNLVRMTQPIDVRPTLSTRFLPTPSGSVPP